jgi:hypothetical protein
MGAANSVYSYVREVDGAIILSRYPQDTYTLESVWICMPQNTNLYSNLFSFCVQLMKYYWALPELSWG